MPGQPRTRSGVNIYGKSGPPFPKGHRHGVRHGGMATERAFGKEMAAKRDDIYDALAESAPVRAPNGELPSHDTFTVRLLAQTLVRIENMEAYSFEHGYFDAQGNLLPYVELLGKEHDRALRMLDAMGMTPKSRVKLGLALQRSATLADAMNEPNRKKRMKLFRELGVVEGEEAEDE